MSEQQKSPVPATEIKKPSPVTLADFEHDSRLVWNAIKKHDWMASTEIEAGVRQFLIENQIIRQEDVDGGQIRFSVESAVSPQGSDANGYEASRQETVMVVVWNKYGIYGPGAGDLGRDSQGQLLTKIKFAFKFDQAGDFEPVFTGGTVEFDYTW